MFRKEIRGPIWGLFFISIGGLLLHLRIHPPVTAQGKIDLFNTLPVIFGITTTFVLPFMFNSRKGFAWAYLINLAAVIAGTIAMAYYSFKNPPDEITATNIILQTTLADILILFAKVPIAQLILKYWANVKASENSGKTER